MSTMRDEITQEIAALKAEIGVLEAHLATGGSWLETETGSLWAKVKGWFKKPESVTPAAAVSAPNVPAVANAQPEPKETV